MAPTPHRRSVAVLLLTCFLHQMQAKETFTTLQGLEEKTQETDDITMIQRKIAVEQLQADESNKGSCSYLYGEFVMESEGVEPKTGVIEQTGCNAKFTLFGYDNPCSISGNEFTITLFGHEFSGPIVQTANTDLPVPRLSTVITLAAFTLTSISELPSFSDCVEARDTIMKLPKNLRWEYDCARNCFWPCAGGAKCSCTCSKNAAGAAAFAMPKSGGKFEGPQCFDLKPQIDYSLPETTTTVTVVGTTITTTTEYVDPEEAVRVTNDEILSVAGLSGEVHGWVKLETHHLFNFTERLVLELKIFDSGLNETVYDHARVYTKGCSTGTNAEYCDACAIAFTASEDLHDLHQDLNLTLTSFCGIKQAHAGFVEEMRGYMAHPKWKDAMAMMKTDRCHSAYAVGASLGGAVAELFAFCANQYSSPEDDSDKAAFGSGLDIIPISFGAPGVAKEPLYNGNPGTCFKGARVAIHSSSQRILDKEDTIEALTIIKEILEIASPDFKSDAFEELLTSLPEALKDSNDVQFSALKSAFVASTMPSIIIQLKDVLLKLLIGSGGGSEDGSMKAFILTLIGPLTKLAFLCTTNDFFWEIAAPLLQEPPQPVYLKPRAKFKYEYDAVPGLLSDFKYKHPLMPFYKVAHPEGENSSQVYDIEACAPAADEPQHDFLISFYATVGNFLHPELAQTGKQGNFPNHHPCCYFRGISGGDEGSCGQNLLPDKSGVKETFECETPTWR